MKRSAIKHITFERQLSIPTEEGVQTTTATYRLISNARMEEMRTMPTNEALKEMVINIAPVVDDEGNEVAYTPELLDEFLQYPLFGRYLLKGYWDGVNGAVLGN